MYKPERYCMSLKQGYSLSEDLSCPRCPVRWGTTWECQYLCWGPRGASKASGMFREEKSPVCRKRRTPALATRFSLCRLTFGAGEARAISASLHIFSIANIRGLNIFLGGRRRVVMTDFWVKPQFRQVGRPPFSTLQSRAMLIKTGLLTEADTPHCHSYHKQRQMKGRVAVGLPWLLTRSSGRAYFVMIYSGQLRQLELIKNYMEMPESQLRSTGSHQLIKGQKRVFLPSPARLAMSGLKLRSLARADFSISYSSWWKMTQERSLLHGRTYKMLPFRSSLTNGNIFQDLGSLKEAIAQSSWRVCVCKEGNCKNPLKDEATVYVIHTNTSLGREPKKKSEHLHRWESWGLLRIGRSEQQHGWRALS